MVKRKSVQITFGKMHHWPEILEVMWNKSIGSVRVLLWFLVVWLMPGNSRKDIVMASLMIGWCQHHDGEASPYCGLIYPLTFHWYLPWKSLNYSMILKSMSSMLNPDLLTDQVSISFLHTGWSPNTCLLIPPWKKKNPTFVIERSMLLGSNHILNRSYKSRPNFGRSNVKCGWLSPSLVCLRSQYWLAKGGARFNFEWLKLCIQNITKQVRLTIDIHQTVHSLSWEFKTYRLTRCFRDGCCARTRNITLVLGELCSQKACHRRGVYPKWG